MVTDVRPVLAVQLLDEEREICIRALDLLLAHSISPDAAEAAMQRRTREIARDLRARLHGQAGAAR